MEVVKEDFESPQSIRGAFHSSQIRFMFDKLYVYLKLSAIV